MGNSSRVVNIAKDGTVRTYKRLNGFGLGLSRVRANYVIFFWSLQLRHIAYQLKDRLRDRHLVIYTGPAVSGFGKYDRTLHEIMSAQGILHKQLRNGCVSIPGTRLQLAARRLNRDLRCGRFEFVDVTNEPPYRICQSFKKGMLEFSMRRPPYMITGNIPHALGSSLNCHLRDDDMGALAVKNRDVEWLTVGLFAEMFKREFGRLKLKNKLRIKFKPLPSVAWWRVRRVLQQSGITVIRKDISLRKNILIAQCWVGYPERDQRFTQAFILKYSLSTGGWSMGPIVSVRYPYTSSSIDTGWRLPRERRSCR